MIKRLYKNESNYGLTPRKGGIFKRLFGESSSKPHILSTPEWKRIVPQLNQELEEVRIAWFKQCAAELSKVRPGAVRKFDLEGEGKFFTDVYQILLAWYFVTANGYVRANEIPAFAMEMQAHLIHSFGAQRVLDSSSRYCRDGREKVTDYMLFSRDMATYMVGTDNDYDALAICRSIAFLTKLTYIITAKCFRDQTAIDRLSQEVEAMARQTDADYVDPTKYQVWKR
jgi:hypothetical protein